METVHPDLFSSLHRWARRQDENFTTEALFAVIRILQERSPEAASDILGRLTAGAVSTSSSAELVVTETQVHTAQGIPDARVTAPGVEVLIEAKVTADVRADQLEGYLRQLNSSPAPVTRLVLLSHYPPSQRQLPSGTVALRWYEVGEWLEGLLERQACDPVSTSYVSQFLQFLRGRGLALVEVNSPVSAALAAFQARSGGTLLENSRYRSLQRLAEREELAPLVSLLKLMDLALASISPPLPFKFDTGKHHGGWIGYNLSSMEYFLSIRVPSPDILYFDTFSRDFDPAAWDGRTGETYTFMRRTCWRQSIDLSTVTPDFFSASKAVQLAILERFVQSSYETASRITRPLVGFDTGGG